MMWYQRKDIFKTLCFNKYRRKFEVACQNKKRLYQKYIKDTQNKKIRKEYKKACQVYNKIGKLFSNENSRLLANKINNDIANGKVYYYDAENPYELYKILKVEYYISNYINEGDISLIVYITEDFKCFTSFALSDIADEEFYNELKKYEEPEFVVSNDLEQLRRYRPISYICHFWHNVDYVNSIKLDNLNLYKQCNKKLSLLFKDDYTEFVGYVFIKFSDRFPEYGNCGFQMTKLTCNSLNQDKIVRRLASHLTFYKYGARRNEIGRLPKYVWFYKSDDETGKLSEYIKLRNNDKEIELIETEDIFICVFHQTIDDTKNSKLLYSRGKERQKFLKEVVW